MVDSSLALPLLPAAAIGCRVKAKKKFRNSVRLRKQVSLCYEALVNLIDVALTRENQSGFSVAEIDNQYDFNRDEIVNLIDVSLARTNQSGFSSLNVITVPGLGGNFGKSEGGGKIKDGNSKGKGMGQVGFAKMGLSLPFQNKGVVAASQTVVQGEIPIAITEERLKLAAHSEVELIDFAFQDIGFSDSNQDSIDDTELRNELLNEDFGERLVSKEISQK